MVIDSSARVAIALREPDCSFYLDRIAEAAAKWISAASLLETSIVVNREKGSSGICVLRRFVADADIRVAEFSENQVQLAFAAHKSFGKSMGHPAQLNILECCTHALAAELEEPVLFKGGDFDKTDIGIVS